MLNALLSVGIEGCSELDEEPVLAKAVRTSLVPVINALSLAEHRADETAESRG